MKNLSATLTNRIQIIARRYGPLAEEVAAHVTLKVLEKMIADPFFAAQGEGYRIKWAKWEAQHWITNEVITYNRYVDVEPDWSDDDGESGNYFEESIPTAGPGVEAQVIAKEERRAVQEAIDQLPWRQQQVARLLMRGYQSGEIAAKLGTSRSNVSHLTDKLQEAMREAVAG